MSTELEKHEKDSQNSSLKQIKSSATKTAH